MRMFSRNARRPSGSTLFILVLLIGIIAISYLIHIACNENDTGARIQKIEQAQLDKSRASNPRRLTR